MAWVVLFALCSSTAHAQEDAPPHHAEPDNGTDPTRMSRSATLTYEHLDLLQGFQHDMFRLEGVFPLGAKKNWSTRLRLPVVSTDTAGDDDYGFGDVSVQLAHVFGMTRKRGFVAQGEFTFDTASRDELGGGQTVFKGTLIYAKFLPHGIFAPALVHSVDVGGGGGDRPDVSITTIDFYYVPKLSGGKYATFDPAINYDWENDRQFASLAVTLGKSIGPAFGGNSQIYIKPSFQIGAERASDWGVEVGYKVIGF
ncbi:MAG: hypothetical protein ABWX88_00125 [Pseudoxanthomonas sp.]